MRLRTGPIPSPIGHPYENIRVLVRLCDSLIVIHLNVTRARRVQRRKLKISNVLPEIMSGTLYASNQTAVSLIPSSSRWKQNLPHL
ncbi:MAG: hypothetical protein JWM99_3131 [Verrucomicrobiales bacterium]|nr:hypothetical protein [Verrucomicrobiales bacterium]